MNWRDACDLFHRFMAGIEETNFEASEFVRKMQDDGYRADLHCWFLDEAMGGKRNCARAKWCACYLYKLRQKYPEVYRPHERYPVLDLARLEALLDRDGL